MTGQILKEKCTGTLILAFAVLVVFAGVSHAQNFGGSAAEQVEQTETAQDGEISDEDILLLMQHEASQFDELAGVDPALSGGGEYVPDESQYTLGAKDVIQIDVQRHPEVSGAYSINSEGKIQYEFVGDIYIEGKKKHEVKEILIEELSKYIIAPELTVKIVGYNSKVIYVFGEVRSPGKVIMRGDTITVREALVQSGLPLLSAKMKEGRLITPSTDNKAKLVKVNVHKLLLEGDLKENLVMKPGDTLYVPPTFWAKTMRVIQPVAAPIGTAAGTGRTLTTGF